jgi:hypothetical protein
MTTRIWAAPTTGITEWNIGEDDQEKALKTTDSSCETVASRRVHGRPVVSFQARNTHRISRMPWNSAPDLTAMSVDRATSAVLNSGCCAAI